MSKTKTTLPDEELSLFSSHDEEREWWKEILNQRDNFIVEKGLWDEFVRSIQ